MSEAGTRAEHIDPALAAVGWGVVEGSRIRREYRNTKFAVVEALKKPLPPQTFIGETRFI